MNDDVNSTPAAALTQEQRMDLMARFAAWLTLRLSLSTAGAYVAVVDTALKRGADPASPTPPTELLPHSRWQSLGSGWRKLREFLGDVHERGDAPAALASVVASAAPRASRGPSLQDRQAFLEWGEGRASAREARSFLKAYETSLSSDAAAWTDRQVGARRAWAECFGRRVPLLPEWSTEALADFRLAFGGFKGAMVRRWTWDDVRPSGLRNPDHAVYVLPLDRAGQREALDRLRWYLAPACGADPLAPVAPGRLAPMSVAVVDAVLRGES